jgi:diguanylate cyclase (GGDEF)-like protein
MLKKGIQLKSLDFIFAAYVVAALLMLAFITWGIFDDTRKAMADAENDTNTYVSATTDAIALEIRNFKHVSRLFATEKQDLFDQIIRSSAPDDHLMELAELVESWFPQALAFTVGDASGKPLISDFKGSVGKVCLDDLVTSATEQVSLVPLHGLSSIPHFDIVTPLNTTAGRKGVLLITFSTNHLVSLLNRHADSRMSLEINLPHSHTGVPQSRPVEESDPLMQRLVDDTNFVIRANLDPGFIAQTKQLEVFRLLGYTGGFSLFAALGGLLLWQARKRILFDAEGLHELNRALYQQSMHDPLTSLPNRRSLTERFTQVISQAKRESVSVAIAVLDIDYFKRVNDQLGHDAGDNCLQLLAEILKARCQRPLDIAIRMGGEEFLICWYDTDAANARRLAETIQNDLRAAPFKHADANDITLSIGVCMISCTYDTPQEEILKAADRALYRAKESGRDRIEFA